MCREWRTALDQDFLWVERMVKEFGKRRVAADDASLESVQVDNYTLNSIAWTHLEPGTPMVLRYGYMHRAEHKCCSFCGSKVYRCELGQWTAKGVTEPLLASCFRCRPRDDSQLITLSSFQRIYRVLRRDYDFKKLKVVFGKYAWIKEIKSLVEEKQRVPFDEFVEMKKEKESKKSEAKLIAMAKLQYENQIRLESKGVPRETAIRMSRMIISSKSNRKIMDSEANVESFLIRVSEVFKSIVGRNPSSDEQVRLREVIIRFHIQEASADVPVISKELANKIHNLSVNSYIYDHILSSCMQEIRRATYVEDGGLSVFPSITRGKIQSIANQWRVLWVTPGTSENITQAIEQGKLDVSNILVYQSSTYSLYSDPSYNRVHEERPLQLIVDTVSKNLMPDLTKLAEVCRRETQLYELMEYYGYDAEHMHLPSIATKFINGDLKRSVECIAMSCISDFVKKWKGRKGTVWMRVINQEASLNAGLAEKAVRLMFNESSSMDRPILKENTKKEMARAILKVMNSEETDILQELMKEAGILPLEDHVLEDILGDEYKRDVDEEEEYQDDDKSDEEEADDDNGDKGPRKDMQESDDSNEDSDDDDDNYRPTTRGIKRRIKTRAATARKRQKTEDSNKGSQRKSSRARK